MKRKNYRVTSTEGHDFVKHAWNSAMRAADDAMRAFARERGTTYTRLPMVSKGSRDIIGMVSGETSWVDSNGHTVKFTIQRLAGNPPKGTTVLLYAGAGVAPEERSIDDTSLQTMRNLIGGGHLRRLRLGKFDLYCDEEGLPKGLPPNRAVVGHVVVGPFFIVGHGADGVEGREYRSLTANEVAWLRNVP